VRYKYYLTATIYYYAVVTYYLAVATNYLPMATYFDATNDLLSHYGDL